MDRVQEIQSKIFEIRGLRVMLDFDFAAMDKQANAPKGIKISAQGIALGIMSITSKRPKGAKEYGTITMQNLSSHYFSCENHQSQC